MVEPDHLFSTNTGCCSCCSPPPSVCVYVLDFGVLPVAMNAAPSGWVCSACWSGLPTFSAVVVNRASASQAAPNNGLQTKRGRKNIFYRAPGARFGLINQLVLTSSAKMGGWAPVAALLLFLLFLSFHPSPPPPSPPPLSIWVCPALLRLEGGGIPHLGSWWLLSLWPPNEGIAPSVFLCC